MVPVPRSVALGGASSLAACAAGFWDSHQAARCVVKLDEVISCIEL